MSRQQSGVWIGKGAVIGVHSSNGSPMCLYFGDRTTEGLKTYGNFYNKNIQDRGWSNGQIVTFRSTTGVERAMTLHVSICGLYNCAILKIHIYEGYPRLLSI